MRFWLWLLAVLVVAQPAWGGKLAGAGKAARGSGSQSSSRANPPSHGTPGSAVDSGSDDFYGALAWTFVRLPFVLPQLALESHGPLPFVYEARPYARRGKGIVRSFKGVVSSQEPVQVAAETYARSAGPPGERAWLPGELVEADEMDAPLSAAAETPPPVVPAPVQDWTAGGQLWAAQVSLDGAAIDADVVRLRPRFRLFTPSRVELDAESSIYREQLRGEDARATGREVDWLTLSAAHVGVRFAQSQAVQFRVSCGPRLMTAEGSAFLGWDISYGFDAFVARPLVLSGNVGIGQVGKALFTEARGSLGVLVGPVELMFGAERVAVGDTVLAGPTAGVRVWF